MSTTPETGSPADPISLAIEAVNKVYEHLGSEAKGLRSRLRELPSLVQEAGLTVTLLFFLSKNKAISIKREDKSGKSRQDQSVRNDKNYCDDIVKGLDNRLLNEYYFTMICLYYGNSNQNKSIDLKSCGCKLLDYLKGKTSKESERYGVALALVTYGLLHICPSILEDGGISGDQLPPNTGKLIEIIKRLRDPKSKCNELVATSLLEDYLLTLKRLAEGLWSGPG